MKKFHSPTIKQIRTMANRVWSKSIDVKVQKWKAEDRYEARASGRIGDEWESISCFMSDPTSAKNALYAALEASRINKE